MTALITLKTNGEALGSAIGAVILVIGSIFAVILIVTVIWAKLSNKNDAKKTQNYLKSDEYQAEVNKEKEKFAEYKKQHQQKIDALLGKDRSNMVIEKGGFLAFDEEDGFGPWLVRSDTRRITFYEQPPLMCEETKRYLENAPDSQYTIQCAHKGSIGNEFTVELSKIFYWTVEGTRQYTEKVSGGGGVDPQAALMGAIIGGAAGAVVGAAMGTQMSISSETQVHDDRVVVLVLTDGRQQAFGYGLYYELFTKVLPDKEKEYMKMNGLLNETPAAAAPAPAPASSSAADELAKFQNLLQSGAITQEEYDAKKAQLLGL